MEVSKMLDKAYHGKTAKELVDSPVSALNGVSEGDEKLLKEAFNVKTIGDLADLKFVIWAQTIANLAKL